MAETRSNAAGKAAAFTLTTTSILGRINTDLAGLTPEQFIAPSLAPPSDNSSAFGTMNDYERRLWTLLSLASDDYNNLSREQQLLQRQINRAVDMGKHPLEALKSLLGGGLKTETIDAYQANERVLLQKLHYV